MIRILTADDEKIERLAVEKMITDQFPDVRILPGVSDGRTLITAVEEQKPDIIIVDINMPGMDGLEALENLRSRNLEAEIIIHTAYSKFDYIHRALKLGASDFILKPVSTEQFHDTLKRCMDNVHKKKADIEQLQARQNGSSDLTEELDQVLKNNVIMSILIRKPDVRSFQIFQKNCLPQQFYSVILAFRTVPELAEEEWKPLTERCRKKGVCLSICYQKILYCCLFLPDYAEAETWRAWIFDWLQPAAVDFMMRNNTELDIGISTLKDSYPGLMAAMDEAMAALGSTNDKTIRFYQSRQRTVMTNVFAGKEALAVSMIRKNETEQLYQKLSELIDQVENKGFIRYAACFFLEELLVHTAVLLDLGRHLTGMKWTIQTRLKALNQLFAEQPEDASMFLERSRYLAYLHAALLELAADEKKPDKDMNQYVETALLYMQRNYNQDISLAQTAEQSGITSFYLSRLLKQECNLTYVDALTDLRISRAVELIQNGKQTNQSIALTAGFSTVEYFQQVFKKVTGMSPGELKERLFRHNED